jgi:hypothetical protein
LKITKPYRITVSLRDYQYELIATLSRQSGVSLSVTMRELIYLPSDLPIALIIKSLRDKHYEMYNFEE